jgi:hypothetical protein
MFGGSFFSKSYFAGTYFAPNEGSVITPVEALAHWGGGTMNMGTMMGRR